MFGIVNVPSISNTTPRSVGRRGPPVAVVVAPVAVSSRSTDEADPCDVIIFVLLLWFLLLLDVVVVKDAVG
jgi:hypothetical protein